METHDQLNIAQGQIIHYIICPGTENIVLIPVAAIGNYIHSIPVIYLQPESCIPENECNPSPTKQL